MKTGVIAGLIAGVIVLAGLGGFALYSSAQQDRAGFLAECRQLAVDGNAGRTLASIPADQLRIQLRKTIACMEDAGMIVSDDVKKQAGLL